MKGMLDRIEDGFNAVILLEEQKREIVIPITQLPAGSQVNSWFTITLENGEIASIEADENLAQEKSARAQSLMQRLRGRKSGSRFKRR